MRRFTCNVKTIVCLAVDGRRFTTVADDSVYFFIQNLQKKKQQVLSYVL